MKRIFVKSIALSGILAALAIVIMCLGGLIPVATYVCPMLCALLCFTVFRLCGRRMAWTWFAAVSILSVLIGPDKEAALVFLFLGYYPILKRSIDRAVCPVIWKFLLFNVAVGDVLAVQIFLLGAEAVLEVHTDLGLILTAVYLVLANITFFMLDFLLTRISNRRAGKR